MAKVITAVLSLRDDFSKSIAIARQVTKDFNRDWKKQMDTIERSSKSVENFGNKMTKAFTDPMKHAAKLVGVVGAIGAKTGFSEALDLQGYKMQLETATKDTAKASKIMRDAVKLANKTPFEAGELVQASAMFESMGMSAQKWLTATGDMAAATNKPFEQATEALIDAQRGELERLTFSFAA